MNRTNIKICLVCLLSMIGATTLVCSQDSIAKPAEMTPRRSPNVLGNRAQTTQGRTSSRPALQGNPLALELEGVPATRVRMRRRVVRENARVERVIEVPYSDEELQNIEEFERALGILKESKDDVARKTAAETIQSHLVKQFEQDLKQRQEELASIEARVVSLRQQLEKRKASQADIISLRLKTILNNTEGLGFPDDSDEMQGALGGFDHPEFNRVEPTRTPMPGRRGRMGDDDSNIAR